ncbi:hypothetical protein WR25_26638 [Diploscapter pachys]|uniref:Uncharacterized protein n=1 Tax=Diploscapter pachys TaxID=2018661 RepID=A0A2A2KHY7_9BILA|nr:hypothetical protein WR25_26638 [Diploscapter pachys]
MSSSSSLSSCSPGGDLSTGFLPALALLCLLLLLSVSGRNRPLASLSRGVRGVERVDLLRLAERELLLTERLLREAMRSLCLRVEVDAFLSASLSLLLDERERLRYVL